MPKPNRKSSRPDIALAETCRADGTRVVVVSTDARATVSLSPADEAELRAAIDEADAGQTLPADQVLRRLPGR